MISPCRCRGTIQYIHLACLRRWIVEEGRIHEDRLTCTLCRSPFVLFHLERIYPRTGCVSYILYNPLAFSILVQYIFLLYGIHDSTPAFNRFKSSQIFIHSIYALVYALYCRVNNRELYGQIVVQRGSYIYPILHIYALWSFLVRESMVMAFATNFLITICWYEHQHILRSINTMLVKNWT